VRVPVNGAVAKRSEISMYDVGPPDGEGRARTPSDWPPQSVAADYLTLPGTREGFGSVHDEKRSIRKWGVSNYFFWGGGGLEFVAPECRCPKGNSS
jgi:hypothetical protein